MDRAKRHPPRPRHGRSSRALPLLAALALGLGASPACDVDAPDAGHLIVTFSLDAALQSLPAARTFEVSLAVKDPVGHLLAERVVVSDLGDRGVLARLPCQTGERIVARAKLVGAYTGVPPGPQGGEGGLALPIAFVVSSPPLTCGERDSVSLTADAGTLTTEPRVGWVTAVVSADVPEALAEHTVAINWQGGVALGGGPVTWRPLESGVLSQAWNATVACDATKPGGIFHVRALRLWLDQAWATADAWSLPEVALPFDCVENEETKLVATPALTVRGLTEGP